MRSAVLGLVTLLLPVPGPRFAHPRGRLAVCGEEVCQWRNFVHDLTPTTTCRRHPGRTDYVPDGTKLRVRCFHEGCLQSSVPVTYWHDMHTAQNFYCPTHLVRV
ncbi:hypothetical protein ACQP2Y_26815 [Actinoplanes sp. CA-051413]|jgi:hypothetical protein|uniref:hypothetical protein n=1 Tax=Actinoplanes sp. CA-051413 TaxID=3239899 RepID=UPI003D981AEB